MNMFLDGYQWGEWYRQDPNGAMRAANTQAVYGLVAVGLVGTGIVVGTFGVGALTTAALKADDVAGMAEDCATIARGAFGAATPGEVGLAGASLASEFTPVGEIIDSCNWVKRVKSKCDDIFDFFRRKFSNRVPNLTNDVKIPSNRGRRGNQATRDHLDKIRDKFLDANLEYIHTHGGRDRFTGQILPEEYIPDPNGRRKGSAYPDLTFEGLGGDKIRINTVNTRVDGTMTLREQRNFNRIYELTDGDPIIAIPKPKE